MHPADVANAAWVFAATPSKVPFYIAGSLLAGWAVLLAVTGLTHPEFPGSEGRARLVMLATAVLVAATMTAAVATSGEEGEEPEAAHGAAPAGTAAPPAVLRLSADPTGRLAYDREHAEVKAGRVTIRFVNRSTIPHDVTLAKGARKVGATKVIDSAETTATAELAPGEYVFFCSVDGHRAAGMEGTLTAR